MMVMSAALIPDVRRTRKDSSSKNNSQRDVRLSCVGIFITLLSTLLAGYELSLVLVEQVSAQRWAAAGAQLLFMLIMAALLYGALVYQFTRLGYYRRQGKHRSLTAEKLDSLWEQSAPELTILVPSYMEELETVTQTLLSAALQEYPKRRVVLLIDDPPEPGDKADQRRLKLTRELPEMLNKLMQQSHNYLRQSEKEYLGRKATGILDLTKELETLAGCYVLAADWFTQRSAEYNQTDHVSRFFRKTILESRSISLEERGHELLAVSESGGFFELDNLDVEYRQLASLFDVEISGFERKKYDNLSHELNKAMNLNAYIALMGGNYRRSGSSLKSVPAEFASLKIPDTDYLLTLDADSILLPKYAAKLVCIAEKPGNERLAVIQTPYSAFPDAPDLLERIAGATTDIQYIVHQGFTASAATYWVGANALLRKTALNDIVTHNTERGYKMPVYIQDRTVIEDTESTVDLISQGWQLHNYPERLAYSATPPDFGSLLIQRRRWANGGLIILPKLLRHLWRSRSHGGIAGEAALRIHYLISIAAVNFGLLITMAFPLVEGKASLWLPVAVIPYFAMLARDLVHCGYRLSDLLRFYALTLVLIPVNIGGVCKSVQQMFTGQKIPFGRTPKVASRTAAPAFYMVFLYVLLIHWGLQMHADIGTGRWFHATFVGINTGLMLYGVLSFVGLKDSCSDIWTGVFGGEPITTQDAAFMPNAVDSTN
jgi:cellulose synthase (UDP-forming)